ncbi:MAG: PAS domain S-box protein, partial [Myxococcota bacterium]
PPANRSLLEGLGYAAADADARSREEGFLSSLVAADDRARVTAHEHELVEVPVGQWRHLVYRVRARDGDHRWLERRDTPYEQVQGKTRVVLGICRDITERHRLEAQLAECRERYLDLAENSREWVCRHDLDGTYRYASPACVELVGYRAEELVGENPYSFFHPEDIPRIRAESHELAQRGEAPSMVTYRFRHRRGHWIWLETLTRRIDDEEGRARALITTSRDVTRRVQQAEALRRERALLDAVFQAIPEATVVASPEREIVRVNLAATEMFGFEARELLGRSAEHLDAAPENATPEAWPNEASVADPFVQLYRRRSGEVFEGETRAATVWGPDRSVLGFLRVIRDVTGQSAMVRDLERANADLEQFARVISHDLQAPIRTISGFIELIDEDYGSQFEEEGRRLFQFVLQGAERMRELIGALLEYSRLEGREPDETSPVAIRELAEGVFADLRADIEKAGADVAYSEAVEGVRVRVNASLFRQALVNLVGNAIKFRRPDVPLRVTVTARPVGFRAVELEVSDNGIGFEQDRAERIFKVFQRLHLREEYEGTGIGLSVVRKVVERHGGTVRAEGRPGEGARFIIELPE